jgi:hypothetical protein
MEMVIVIKYYVNFVNILVFAAKLEIHTVGFNGEIRIKAIRMGKYLAMGNTGNVTLVASISAVCLAKRGAASQLA